MFKQFTFLRIALLMLPFWLTAQEPCTLEDYKDLIEKAGSLAKNNQKDAEASFTRAIKLYRAAQICRPEKRREVDRLVDDVYAKIERLNQDLKVQITKTDEALTEAKNQQTIAEERAKRLAKQNEQLEQQKKTSDLAAQAGIAREHNQTHAIQLTNRACEASCFLNQAATDARNAVWSDYTQLFYQKSYFHPLKSGITRLATDNRYLAAGAENGDVVYWDIETAEIISKKTDPPHVAVTGLGISQNGVTALAKGNQLILSSGDREYFYSNPGPVNTVCISQGNRFVVFSGQNAGEASSNIRWALVQNILDVPPSQGFSDKMRNIGAGMPGVRHAIFSKGNLLGIAGMDGLGRVYRYDAAVDNFVQTLVLKGHTAPLHSIAFSNDSHPYIVTTSEDGTIRLWSSSDSVAISIIGIGHDDDSPVYAAFIDGTDYIVSCSQSGKAFVWNRNGQLVYRLSGHAAPLSHAMISPNGQYLFTGDREGVIRRWHIAPRCERDNRTHTDAVTASAFIGTDRLLTANVDKTLKIWDKRTGKCLSTLKGHLAAIECVAVSPDQKMIASGGRDNIIRLWRTDGTLIRTFSAHGSTVYAVQFMPKKDEIVSVDKEGVILLWDKRTGTVKNQFSTSRQGSQALCIGTQGDIILTAGEKGKAIVWRRAHKNWGWEQETIRYEPNEVPEAVTGISLTPNDDYVLLTGGQYAMVQNLKKNSKPFLLHSTGAGKFVKGWFSPVNPFDVLLLDEAGALYHTASLKDSMPVRFNTFYGTSSALYAPEGDRVVLGSTTGNTRMIQLKDKKELVLYGGTNLPIRHIFYDTLSKMVITADTNEVVCRHTDGRYIRHWKESGIRDVSHLNVENESILTIVGTESARLYDLKASNAPPVEIPLRGENVEKIKFSPDGKCGIIEYKDSLVVKKLQDKSQNKSQDKSQDKSQNKSQNKGSKTFLGVTDANWITNEYFYTMENKWPKKCSIVSVSDTSKHADFLLKETDDLLVALSPDGEKVIFAGKQHGNIFLFTRNQPGQYTDIASINEKINAVKFIDNQHFVVSCGKEARRQTLRLYGITRDAHAVESREKQRPRISTVLQQIGPCDGPFAFKAADATLIVAHGHEFISWPLALMHHHDVRTDTMRLPEFSLYNLEVDHFKVVEKPQLLPDLAM